MQQIPGIQVKQLQVYLSANSIIPLTLQYISYLDYMICVIKSAAKLNNFIRS